MFLAFCEICHFEHEYITTGEIARSGTLAAQKWLPVLIKTCEASHDLEGAQFDILDLDGLEERS